MQTDTLAAISARLCDALRAGAADRLFLAATALRVQRLIADVAADPTLAEEALRIAQAAEAAALSLSYTPDPRSSDVSL